MCTQIQSAFFYFYLIFFCLPLITSFTQDHCYIIISMFYLASLVAPLYLIYCIFPLPRSGILTKCPKHFNHCSSILAITDPIARYLLSTLFLIPSLPNTPLNFLRNSIACNLFLHRLDNIQLSHPYI